MIPTLLAFAATLGAPTVPWTELRALETFDAAWTVVQREHYDPALGGVDWRAVRDELRPRAAELEDEEELRALIREMLGRLERSHFSLIDEEDLGTGAAGSEASPAGTAGLDLRWIDGQLVVVEVTSGGPAAWAGVRPGWTLVSVDGHRADELLDEARGRDVLRDETAVWKAALRAVDGAVDSEVTFVFRDLDEHQRTRTLRRVARDAEVFDMPGLPTFFLRSESRIVESVSSSSAAGRKRLRIGVLRFSNWFWPLVATLDEALLGMRACDAIVLDLRGNTGGDGTVAAAVAGHFFERRTSLGSMRTRHGAGQLEVVPRLAFGDERVAPFRGPVAILVDETTGSTSEVFTGGMQALGRARVFGGRTAGAVLPATLTELPNGDSLLHAIAEFTTPSGDVLEERGVLPDEPVAPTRAGLADGEDVVLAAALAWIAEHADG